MAIRHSMQFLSSNMLIEASLPRVCMWSLYHMAQIKLLCVSVKCHIIFQTVITTGHVGSNEQNEPSSSRGLHNPFKTINRLVHNMSRIMRKSAFCICENKDPDQLHSYCAVNRHICCCCFFAT